MTLWFTIYSDRGGWFIRLCLGFVFPWLWKKVSRALQTLKLIFRRYGFECGPSPLRPPLQLRPFKAQLRAVLSHWELFHWFLCLCVSVLTPSAWLQIHLPTLRTVVFASSNLRWLSRCSGRPSSPLPCSCSCRPAALQSGRISPRSAGTPSLRCSLRGSSSRSFAATRSTRCRISSAQSSVSITPRSEWLCGKLSRFSSLPLSPLLTAQTAPVLCRNFNSSGWCVFTGFLKMTMYIFWIYFSNVQARCESHLVTVHRSVYVEGRGRSRAVHEGSCKG